MTIESWIKLLGFGAGALLHVYLTYVIARQGLRGARRWALFSLVTSLGLWHLGNAMKVLVDLLSMAGADRVGRIFETIAYVGLAILPSVLLYTFRIHLRGGGKAESRRRGASGYVDALLFLPLVFLPRASWLLATGSEPSVIARLGEFVFPFIVWLAAAMFVSAGLSRKMARQSREYSEIRLLAWLSRILVVIGAGLIVVYLLRLREWPVVGSYLETAQMLSSIIPTTLVAYHIYRYNYLELVIRRSIVYSLLFASLLSLYFFGIRHLSAFLEARYNLAAVFTESFILSAVVAVSIPISNWINRFITRQVRTYRDFVLGLNERANSILDLKGRIEFLEQAIRNTFDFRGVYVFVYKENGTVGDPLAVDESLVTPAGASLDNDSLSRVVEHLPAPQNQVLKAMQPGTENLLSPLAEAGVNYGFQLRFENLWVGLLLIDSHPLADLGDVEDLLLALSGQISGSIANGRLLDSKLRLERDLARQERLVELGRMAATMAHEVKNPLSSIKTLVQLMREDTVVGRIYGEDLDLINEEIGRLTRTVTQLLSFARPFPSAGNAPAQLETVHVQELVRTAASVVTKSEREDRPEFHFETEAGLPPITIRSSLLQEVLANLFMNALQASKQTCKINVRCYRSSQESGSETGIMMEIEDDGPGIEKSIQPKVFDAFFTTKQRGTGLGLFVVKRNIEILGGNLRFRSPVSEGRGTQFLIFIPSRGCR